MDTQVKTRRASNESTGKLGSNRLSPEDLAQLLDLLKGANSLELKLMVPDSERGAIRRLGFDPVEAEPRQVFFYDTPDLQLNKAGLIVRARRSKGDKGDTVVKLRPIDPESINAELRHDQSFKVEVDIMPGGYVCSGSAKGRCTGREIFEVGEGKLPLESLFNRNQREFYDAHAPAGLSLNDLVPLGPTFLLRLKHQPKRFDRLITVELWLYPDGSRILEMSTKGLPEETFQLGAQFKAFVTSCGLTLASQATTKTSSALNYFSKQLGAKPAR